MYFLFLRSAPPLLISFFGSAEPGGMPNCIGERDGAGAELTAIVVAGMGGTDGGGGAETGGGATGSGSGLGRMCFNRLFL